MVREANDFLVQPRAGGGAESTSQAYAGAVTLFRSGCSHANVSVGDAARRLGRFVSGCSTTTRTTRRSSPARARRRCADLGG